MNAAAVFACSRGRATILSERSLHPDAAGKACLAGKVLIWIFKREHAEQVWATCRFIASKRPGATGSLMTAFPPKQLSSDSETLVQAGLLNSVITER